MSKIVGQLLLKQNVTTRSRTPAGGERRAKKAWETRRGCAKSRSRFGGRGGPECSSVNVRRLCFQSVLGGLGKDRLRGAPRVVREGVASVVQKENTGGEY